VDPAFRAAPSTFLLRLAAPLAAPHLREVAMQNASHVARIAQPVY
jgi:hypothetical protein